MSLTVSLFATLETSIAPCQRPPNNRRDAQQHREPQNV
jgi:hypothetical protein